MELPEGNPGSQRRQASPLLEIDTHLTPAEALRKVRAAAEGPAYPPSNKAEPGRLTHSPPG
ncbi:hypothetical protein ACI3L1_17530 [Deinococcus sp. SM5_A1]|uniref:hypothetical protein n=1 Tax=Deinococcus sp. SM5_A1 TaxID=3379094 RepID=UPI003859BB4D